MGTNYYLKLSEGATCEHCGSVTKPEEVLHIGKSSAGWCFSLHVLPEQGITSLSDWCVLFARPGVEITNEYGDKVGMLEMLGIIMQRSNPKDWGEKTYKPFYESEEHFHARNHSERGPNNLLRHRIGDHCVGHGEGTWDYIKGEFC